MIDGKQGKVWSSNECLPRGFSEWLKDTVRDFGVNEKMEIRVIAAKLGVKPSLLSRWIAGMGPLRQNDIRVLSSNLGVVVYTFLSLARPR